MLACSAILWNYPICFSAQHAIAKWGPDLWRVAFGSIFYLLCNLSHAEEVSQGFKLCYQHTDAVRCTCVRTLFRWTSHRLGALSNW